MTPYSCCRVQTSIDEVNRKNSKIYVEQIGARLLVFTNILPYTLMETRRHPLSFNQLYSKE